MSSKRSSISAKWLLAIPLLAEKILTKFSVHSPQPPKKMAITTGKSLKSPQ